MNDDEEPPALTSSSSKGTPPAAAFSSGGPPPATVFTHNSSNNNNNGEQQQHASPSSDDLNSRWKKYESEQSNNNAVIKSNNNNNNNDEASSGSTYNNYNLYETPEKFKRSSSSSGTTGNYDPSSLEQPLEPRRTYSFTKSNSFTNSSTAAIMAKYAGVAGIPRVMPTTTIPSSSLSMDQQQSSAEQDRPRLTAAPTSSSATMVREEAMKVLAMADQSTSRNSINNNGIPRRSSSSSRHSSGSININQPIDVRRTESGGFRAVVGGNFEDENENQNLNAIQPYYAKRDSGSNNNTSKMRIPSALAGLGFGGEESKWKPGRYSFSDPQFREDDYYDHEDEEEEDDIIRTTAAASNNNRQYSEDENGNFHGGSYRNDPKAFDTVEFEGDFPQKPSDENNGDQKPSWSSRYSSRISNSNLLDRWDRNNNASNDGPRQSARNMFMSTANNVRTVAENVVSNSASVAGGSGGNVFGAGFSFRQSYRFGNNGNSPAKERDEGPNLRSIWKDDESSFHDEDDDVGIGGGKKKRKSPKSKNQQHKTWESVMHEKKRRRKICLVVACVIVLTIVIAVSLTQTSDRWSIHKRFFDGSGKGIEVTFYATSNTDDGGSTGSQKRLQQDLQSIPNDAEFIAHLGNLQDASITQCPANRNEEIASILKRSPVPVLIVPGEHDWLNCPTENYALARWMDAFHKFTETSFADHQLAKDLTRPHTTPELFAALHNGVLFIGLHLVNGSLHKDAGLIQYQEHGINGDDDDKAEEELQQIKEEKMKIFVRGMLDSTLGQFRAIVLMGNARPSQQQVSFFVGIAPYLQQTNAPVIYLHSDSNKVGTMQHHPFASGVVAVENDDDDEINEYLKELLAVQVPNGGLGQSPLRISVGFGKEPFQIG